MRLAGMIGPPLLERGGCAYPNGLPGEGISGYAHIQNSPFLLISPYVVLIFSSANFISATNAVTRLDAGDPTALTR